MLQELYERQTLIDFVNIRWSVFPELDINHVDISIKKFLENLQLTSLASKWFVITR